ncbi:MAG: PEGA domain-containing protein [Bacteroidota bacterium]
MRSVITSILVFLSITAVAQLREFKISPMTDPGTHVVQASADYPDDAILLIYSSFDNLSFRSSMAAIDKVTYNASSHRYEVLIQPLKQLIFVAAVDFIETQVGIVSPNPKQAIYYEVNEYLGGVISARGSIYIQSQPSEATVIINDIESIYKTPTTREIPAGTYQVSLRLDKYISFDTVLRVNQGEKISLRKKLVPTWAEVFVTAQPGDASISINGVTRTGQLELSGPDHGLIPGPYLVKVERVGHRTYTQSFDLKAGQQLKISPSLEEVWGSLLVNTEPQGASVRIGDKILGETPLQTKLLTGPYQLVIEKKDHARIDLPITIHENKTESISQILKSGKEVNIISVPSGADFTVDGHFYGTTPMTVTLRYGGHKVDVTSGAIKDSKTIEVKDDEQTDYNFDVREEVSFTISSTPSEASVFIDGDFKGHTPLTTSAKVGQAQLRVSKGHKWADVERTVNINDSSTFDFTLSHEETWNAERQALLAKLYDDDWMKELFRGPLQIMQRGDRRYLQLPSLFKATNFFIDDFTRGLTPASGFFSIGVLSDTQIGSQQIYYEVGSVSLGVAFANPTHTFRLFLEARASFAYEGYLHSDDIRLYGRQVSAWKISGMGKIDRTGKVERIGTPLTLKASMDFHLHGRSSSKYQPV